MSNNVRETQNVVLILISLATWLMAQTGPDSTWPMFCHDLAHTGLSPVSGYMDTCYLYWSYITNGQIFSSPTIGDIDGNGDIEVVIGSDDVNIYAFNGEDGSLLWTYPTGSNEYSSAALGDIDGNGDIEVVIGSVNNAVYALNGENGSLLWTHPTGGMMIGSPALADIDGDANLEVVIGSWDANVYALNGENGSQLWAFPTGGLVRSSPAIADIDGDSLFEVVIGSWDHYVYAINGENGSLLWSYLTGDGVRSSPAIGDIDLDGALEVVIGSEDNRVHAINGEDGSYLWSYITGSDVRATPALADIDNDDSLEVIIGSIDYNVYALRGHNGSLIWSYATNFGIWSSAAVGDVDGDGTLEVVVGSGTSDNSVYTLNGENGSLLWKYTTGDGIAASPALGDIDCDGLLEVVIGSEDNSVYALSAESVPPVPFNLISPPDSTLLAVSRPTFVWQSSYDSLSGLAYYRMYIEDTLRAVTPDTTWTANYDLSEGYNSWYVYAVDNAGNTCLSNQTWVIFIDTSGPRIESTTVWVDTTFTGPFPVETKITDITNVDTVTLYYQRLEDPTWCMATMVQTGGNWYYGEIPQVALSDDTIRYYVYATDILSNNSTDPVGAPANCYSFRVYSTGVNEFTSEQSSFVFRPKSNPARGLFVFEGTLPNLGPITLSIYDITGRLIYKLNVTMQDQPVFRNLTWSPTTAAGVYFYFLDSVFERKFGKLVLVN